MSRVVLRTTDIVEARWHCVFAGLVRRRLTPTIGVAGSLLVVGTEVHVNPLHARGQTEVDNLCAELLDGTLMHLSVIARICLIVVGGHLDGVYLCGEYRVGSVERSHDGLAVRHVAPGAVDEAYLQAILLHALGVAVELAGIAEAPVHAVGKEGVVDHTNGIAVLRLSTVADVSTHIVLVAHGECLQLLVGQSDAVDTVGRCCMTDILDNSRFQVNISSGTDDEALCQTVVGRVQSEHHAVERVRCAVGSIADAIGTDEDVLVAQLAVGVVDGTYGQTIVAREHRHRLAGGIELQRRRIAGLTVGLRYRRPVVSERLVAIEVSVVAVAGSWQEDVLVADGVLHPVARYALLGTPRPRTPVQEFPHLVKSRHTPAARKLDVGNVPLGSSDVAAYIMIGGIVVVARGVAVGHGSVIELRLQVTPCVVITGKLRQVGIDVAVGPLH